MSKKVVGRCSRCGGAVSAVVSWRGSQLHAATCERCGSVEDVTNGLPTIRTVPPSRVGRIRESHDRVVKIREAMGRMVRMAIAD